MFGFRDWPATPADTHAKRVGLFHGLGNVILVMLFLMSWLIRRGDPIFVPSTPALILSFAAILRGTLTAWLGVKLVYRLAVAVDPGANLNEPSSLAGPVGDVGLRMSGVAVPGDEKREPRGPDDPG